jgi:hypothetical protein
MSSPKQPQKTTKNHEPDFGEILTPTLAFTPAVQPVPAGSARAAMYGSIMLVAILSGIGVGLLMRPAFLPQPVGVTAGPVAVVTDPPLLRVLAARQLAAPPAVSTNLAPVEVTITQPAVLKVTTTDTTAANLQPAISSASAQATEGINFYQPAFSAYGYQGSVGTQGVR